jgi:hypothetical protein
MLFTCIHLSLICSGGKVPKSPAKSENMRIIDGAPTQNNVLVFLSCFYFLQTNTVMGAAASFSFNSLNTMLSVSKTC